MNAIVLQDGRIKSLATSLLERWCVGLIAFQASNPEDPTRHGGIYSPGDQAYLGRSADSIVAFLWMAEHTGDERYIEAAKNVYLWEQNNCWSEELGCWYNEPTKPDGWKGITVFAAMTKLEALEHYSGLLGDETAREWAQRLHRAAEYICRNFHIGYYNINYPATATLALYKLGRFYNEEKYTQKAAEIAEGLLEYFTPDGLFFGENGRAVNEDGQYPVDLGYNVEESLPSMALYSRLAGDRKLYAKVLESMKVHLEFMLPNGGWDNSWGIRNYKWTLWGSRTSDGCHPGYYALADEKPVFAEAVYRNLKCLEACTHDNLLHSGPHEHLAGVSPSTHHTFDHAKALAILLNTAPPEITTPRTVLPREQAYGIKKYDSINTLLFSKGSWRGTVTGYSPIKKKRLNGNATGGALSLLYHMQTGMVNAASMTEYQRWEKSNMLDENRVENFINLTPRLELTLPDKSVYRNISDRNAVLSYEETADGLLIKTKSRLVDGEQDSPEAGAFRVSIDYRISDRTFRLEMAMDEKPTVGNLRFIYPVICTRKEQVHLDTHSCEVKKSKGTLRIESNYELATSLPLGKRVYNVVPGLQAFPIEIECAELHREKLIFTIRA